MSVRLLWLLLALLLVGPVRAQLVELDACSGNLERCITPADTLYEMCFSVKASPTCAFKSFEMDWNDGKVEKFTASGPIQIKHTYDLRSFLKNCGSGANKQFRLFIVTDCPGDNKGVILTFKIKPNVDLPPQDACENQTVRLINNTCPQTSDMKWEWDFGDGTKSTSSNPSKAFSNSATAYTVTLSATNTCGTDSKKIIIPVRKMPEAKIKATDYSFLVRDTTITCLPGSGSITMDATTSLDGTSYQWSITPSTYRYIQGTNSSSPVAKIQFLQTGEYTITLIARNSCGVSKPAICPHRVESAPQIQLTKQLDACEPISYQLKTTTPLATFTLNGQPIKPNDVLSLSVSATPYIVRGELNGQCGNRVEADTILVQAPEAVKISLGTQSTAVCVGTPRFALPVNVAGGSWAGSGSALVETQGSTYFFNPRTVGTYDLIYQRGSGACRQTDAVRLEVQGGQVTANNQSVCAQTPFVRLTASQAGGVWRSAAFPSAIRNDTLFLATVTGNSVALTYELAIGSAACPARATATVSIGRPRAAFAVSGTCTGVAPTLQNTSSGATAYQWALNGQVFSTTQLPTLNLSAGQNVLSLTVGTGSCTDTTSRSIKILAPPQPISFSPDKTGGCAPLTVSFSVPGAANPDVQYRWDYGNGTSATTFSPTSQTYRNTNRQAQVVPVLLTARNACGVQSFSTTLTVRPLAKAEIGVDSTTFRCSPARVKFSNRSTGQTPPGIWLWGDGSGPLASPADTLSHLFSTRDSARTFRVQLIVSSECGRDTDAVAIRLYPPTVKPLFELNTSRPCSGELVQFKDATTPKPDRWFWRFGDGKTDTQANPQHAFAEPNKTYTITLIAFTACGYDSLRRTITTVASPTGVIGKVEAFGCVGQTVSFTNRTNPQNRFVWNFGDGSPLDSVMYAPSHPYKTPGNYAATLTIFGDSRSCKTELRQPVEVRAKPVAKFTAEGDVEQCSPATIRLLATGDNLTWQWQLSDGQRLTGQQPTVALTGGRYDVTLKASYNGACPDSVTTQAALRVLDCSLRVPDAFSPGGFNPRWTVFGEGIDRLAVLRVRSRWGEIIFEARDIPAGSLKPTESWDGTFNGVPMPAGAYTYETDVLYKGGTQERKVGSLILMR